MKKKRLLCHQSEGKILNLHTAKSKLGKPFHKWEGGGRGKEESGGGKAAGEK